MYSNNYQYHIPYPYSDGDRIVGGGFAAPFLLGGLTGALLSPYFYQRPVFYPIPPVQPYYYPYRRRRFYY
ncbi:MAG: hypothetical protein GX190_02075 [Mollicutes bacterium]|nr:hypothetical protein [Mollicutes bacterium]